MPVPWRAIRAEAPDPVGDLLRRGARLPGGGPAPLRPARAPRRLSCSLARAADRARSPGARSSSCRHAGPAVSGPRDPGRSRCMTSSALRSMTSSSGTSPGGYNSSSSPGTLLAGPGMRVLEAFWRRDEGGSLTEAATKPGPPPALEHIGVVLSFVTFGSRSGPAMDNRSACGRRLDGGRGADGSGLADLSGGPCGGLLAGALALAPGGVVAARAAGRGGHWALGGGVDGWANRTGSWPRSRQVTLAAGWTPLRKVGRCWARLPGCHDGCSRTLAGPAARPGVATPLSSPGEPGTGRLLAYLEVGQR